MTTANLGNAALVAAAFNSEFVITAANGEDALLVVNDTNGSSFSLWQWIQAGGGEVSAAELTLIGTSPRTPRVVASQLRLRLNIKKKSHKEARAGRAERLARLRISQGGDTHEVALGRTEAAVA